MINGGRTRLRTGPGPVDRPGKQIRDPAAELADAVRVEVIACDVTDAEQHARLFDTVAGSPVEAEIAQVLCPGPVHTEFARPAGLDSDGYPPFLYMPSRKVARICVDALDADRGVVVAGLPMRIVGSPMRLTPRPLLLPALVPQNRGLKRARA
ncbi:hypothetical protein AB0E04_37665 [Streptomyces sp. NPDC048251]|uniref:hypothetical protein n=1 Tax=Streptomyces sp. NPDC048251 TaxID=3154501 RepID=UPI00343393CE